MSAIDVYFILAIVCMSICGYIFGFIHGFRKGKRASTLEVFQSTKAVMDEVFIELNITPEQLVDATKSITMKKFKAAGLPEHMAKEMVDIFLTMK